MTDVHTLEKSLSGESPRWRKVFAWTLALFFFLLPLQTRYFLREVPLYEYGTLSVYAVEVLGWIVIALYFIRTWKQGSIKTLSRVSMFHCFLVLMAFVSIIWAPDKLVALQGAVRLLEGVLLFRVVRQMSDVRCQVLVWSFLAGALLQSLLGIYQFLTQSSFALTWLGMALHDPRELGTSVVQFADERWLRAYGGLPHPNVFGGYLVLALAVLVLFIWRGRAKAQTEARPPYIVFAIAPILLTGIFFTFSRVAWVVALVVLGWWVLQQIRQRGLLFPIGNNRPWIVGLVVAWLAVLAVMYWPLVSTRLNLKSAERLEVKARVERVAGVREAWEIIKKHPVVGVGIGNYTQVVQRDLRPGQSLWSYQPVHSVPMLVWAELGTIGLILFVGVLWKVATHIPERSLAVLGMTTFGVLLLLDHYLWTLPCGVLLFWAILGLSTALKQEGS